MAIIKWIRETIQYLWKGTVRIFSPTDDDYPKTGVQPFEGESYKENQDYS